MSIWKKLNEKGTVVLGVIGLIGILIATAGVITRFVLKISIAWSDELLRTTFEWGYFVGAAFCYEEGGIMRLQLVEDSLEKHRKTVSKAVLALVCDVVNFLFFSASSYFVYLICMQHAQRGTTSGTSNTPAWVLPASYGVCCLLIALIAIRDFIRDARLLKADQKGRSDADPA